MRVHAFIQRAVIAATLVACAVVPCTSVYAHGDEAHTSAQHAADDLADMSISEIEKQTNQNKLTSLRQKGFEPGATRNSSGKSIVNAAPTAVPSDPGVSGSWSSAITTPVIPIFQAVLPNGKVLMWDSVGDNASETYTNHTFTRAMVWDPDSNTYKRVDVQGYNIFCAGFAHMINGNILVAGGNKNKALAGIVQTHIFDWRTETWSRGRDMAGARWYPSLATMANGEQVIIGGGPAFTEVYQTNGLVRRADGFTNAAYGGRIYPFMTSRPDTLLQLIGPYNAMYTVGFAGNGSTLANKARDGKDRQYGSFATYDIGKHLVIGGGSLTEGGVSKVPTKTAVVINTNTALAPTVTATGSLSVGRRQHNATVLADGSVLVTGGMTSAATSDLVDLERTATWAERWDPATGQWTALASANRIRQYHSTASLLPDGRVLTGGGGVCGDCMKKGYLEKNIEYFTPPYLYRKDGSGQLASRPTIASAPASIAINATFTVASPQASTIRKVGLVGLADVTHSVDQGQRYVPLAFTANGTNLSVKSPTSGGIAPPGYYMLFVTDTAGVPSMAKIVQVAMMSSPVNKEIRNAGANRCIDIPGASLKIKTALNTYNCNNSKAQAVTHIPTDNSLRILGLCIDVAGAKFTSGQKVQTYNCNGTNAQQWELRSDGTIRPKAKTTLCLATASAKNKAAMAVATCKASTLQKWTW